MLLRRATPLALALAVLACEPSVPFNTANNPQKVDYAAFQPAPSSAQANPPNVPADIPLPNDLALQPSAIATQPPAQAALLQQWAAQGGFPNDQEVPVTIDLVEETINASNGAVTRSAPAIDTSTINPSNLLVLALNLTTGAANAVAYDKPTYATAGDHGVLTVRKSPDPANGGSRRWPSGSEIIVALRGGPAGLKVVNNPSGLQPQPAMYLLLQDKDLTQPANQGIIACDPPVPCTRAQKAALAAQLEQVRKNYLVPFAAIDASGAFNHRELAVMSTFAIASTNNRTHVETDPSAGRIPLPSDFLMDATGHLSTDAQAAFGPLGPGLATLDGFSETAMILAQTSTAIQAGTVQGGVFIYEVTGGSPPMRRLLEATEALTSGKAPEYAAEPSPIVQGGLSTVIGLQPAIPAQVGPNVVPIPPLKEGTTYVVLVTDKVKDLNGAPLVRSTLGQILLLDPSIKIAANGKSTVSGVSDAQAAGLDQMRVAINGAIQFLTGEKAISRDHVVMGYTFKTQSGIKSTAALLAALPYATPLTTLAPPGGAATVYCSAGIAGANPACTTGKAVTDAFNEYGIDPAINPNGNIGYVIDTTMVTFNKLLCNPGDTTCHDTGAFNPATVAPVAEPVRVLIAAPNPPFNGCVPGAAGNSPNGVCTLPLVVFRHGFGGGRAQMLAIADRLNAAGYVVAAIDAAKHGDRSYCSANNQCASGGTCVPNPAQAGEGDAVAPGKCSTDFVRVGQTGCATCTNTKAVPAVSSNYLITPNFFRTRDTFRQDIIDESQLARVLSPNPGCSTSALTTAANTCANQMITAATGIQIDPAKIDYAGQSLGSLNGVPDVAANPRFSRAVFNVGGSTIVDIFTDPSGAFAANLNALLASLGIQPGTASYLQFINVAKWVLDPADPENFARSLLANPIATPLPFPNTAKKVYGQTALCDGTVPNTWNANLYTLIGLPFNPGQANTTTAAHTLFFAGATATPSCPANAVKHGFLLDWKDYPGATNITQKAQDDIAGFFADSPTAPPSVEIAP